MTALLNHLASALICPMGLLYIYLLNDRWRVRPLWRWALLALCGPVSVWMAGGLRFLPTVVRVIIPWVVVLALCWAFSAVRDARFFFVAATGLLFTYLSTMVGSMVAYYLGVHRAILRLALDCLLLLLGRYLFCPAFRAVYHNIRKGWAAFALMPLSLLCTFFSLLIVSDYAVRYHIPVVQGFTYLLTLFTFIFYCASFYFFRKLGGWQESEVDKAVLSAQISTLTERMTAGQSGEERRRILRHDLRHYLRILSACLRTEDRAAALRTLDALSADLEESGAAREEAFRDE